MRIIIDGDSMPSINQIISQAKEKNIPVVTYCDDTHQLKDEYMKIITVSKNYQAVDMKILEDLKKDDILITNDYGLASLALLKINKVVNSIGKTFDNTNIEFYLNNRYQNQKLNYQIGPKKRTNNDEKKLIETLKKLISN